MKVKKLFAGLSAAALAASMLSMASFAEEPGVDDSTVPTLGACFFVQGNKDWQWASVDGKDDGIDTVTITGNGADLASKSKTDNDTEIGAAGIQLFVGNYEELGEGAKITGNYTINIKDESKTWDEITDAFEIEVKKNPWGPGLVANTNLSLVSGEWENLTKMGDFTATVQFDEVQVTLPVDEGDGEGDGDFESDYDTVVTVKGAEVKQWADTAWSNIVMDEVFPATGIKVTVDYTILPEAKEGDGHSFAFMEGHGWPKMNDAYDQPGAMVGIRPTTEATNKDDLAKYGTPLQKDDGWVVLPGEEGDKGSLTFYVTPAGVEYFKKFAHDNPGEDGGLWWAQGYQVNAVLLDKVTYEYNKTTFAEAGQDVHFGEGQTVSPDGAFGSDVDLSGSTIVLEFKGVTADDKAEGQTAVWNSERQYYVRVDHADESVDYLPVIGSDVHTDVLINDNGTPDKADDDVLVPNADCVVADENGVAFVEIDYQEGDTYTLVGVSEEKDPEDAYAQLVGMHLVSQTGPAIPEFDWTETDDSSDSQADSSDSQGDSSSDSQGDSSSNSQADNSSKADSSKADSSSKAAAGNKGGSNANTGAVAFGLGALTLAGAAIAVSKKKQ